MLLFHFSIRVPSHRPMALNPDDCPLKFVPYILQHIFLMLSDERCWANPAPSTALITERREAQFEQVPPKHGTRNTWGRQWQVREDTRSVIYCSVYSHLTRRSVLGKYVQLLASAGMIRQHLNNHVRYGIANRAVSEEGRHVYGTLRRSQSAPPRPEDGHKCSD
jgi:hypothetical protein